MSGKVTKKTTKSTRRYTYESFKQKLDSISINSTTRSLNAQFKHDVSDDSFHFNEALSRWKEVNLSKNFTDFCRDIHPYVNSLAQLLYHKQVVFGKLKQYIDLHDNISLEPLLDLLSQFVHDLGEDFIEFYPESMKSLISLFLDVGSTNSNDTVTNQLMSNDNVIQWCFTSIVFIFKHLSKVLVKDLQPTLEVFYPCLILFKKFHILRFVSEAISFLIKKSPEKSVSKSLDFFKIKLDELKLENEKSALRNSLQIIFTESVKNVSGSFHSKALNNNLKLILNKAFDTEHINGQFVMAYCDVALTLLIHGEAENVTPIYQISINFINQFITEHSDKIAQDEKYIIAAFEILSALSFAEAGYKNSSWKLFNPCVRTLIKQVQLNESKAQYSSKMYEIISYFFTIVLRNAPMDFLAKFHPIIFQSMLKLDNSKWFLGFIDTSLAFQKEKTLIFGSKMISDYIVKHWKDHSKQISLFLTNVKSDVLVDLSAGTKYAGNKLSVSITADFYNSLIEDLNKLLNDLSGDSSTVNDSVLLEIYWRLLVLKYARHFKDYEILVQLFLKIFDQQFDSLFVIELAGNILDSLSKQDVSDTDRAKLLQKIVQKTTYTAYQEDELKFMEDNKLLQSNVFILGLANFINTISKDDKKSIELLNTNSEVLISSLSNCLLLPSHEIRSNVLGLISTIFIKTGKDVSVLINSAQTTEDVPMNLEHGRDLALRIRQLSSEFDKPDHKELERIIVVKWLFGFLSNKFKPVWDSILENIEKFVSKAEQQVWSLIQYFLYNRYSDADNEVFFKAKTISDSNNDENGEGIVENVELGMLDSRITSFYFSYNERFSNYYDLNRYLVKYSNGKRENTQHSTFIRFQSLNLLLKVPSLAEKKARFLVPIFLSDDTQATETYGEDEEDDSDFNSAIATWTVKDKNILIDLFGKFKNIKNIYKSDEVYQRGSELLCSRNAPIQKAALNVILAYKVPGIRKYADNLRNMLDETSFKDEIITFFNDNRAEDLNEVIGVILRILYGKSKVRVTSNSKQSKKNSIIKLLATLPENFVVQFLELGYGGIDFDSFFSNKNQTEDEVFGTLSITDRLMRQLSGFVNLLSDLISELKAKFPNVLEAALKPLVYAVSVSQYSSDKNNGTNTNLEKASKKVRQVGLKNLNSLFGLLRKENYAPTGDEEDDALKPNFTFEWENYFDSIYQFVVKPRLDKFSTENLQSPSSLLKIIVSWANVPEYTQFLFVDDFKPTRALLELFEHSDCKSSVLIELLNFALNIVSSENIDENFEKVRSLVIASSLKTLPQILTNVTVTKDVISRVVELLLLLIDKKFVQDNHTLKVLCNTLVHALDKSTFENYNNLDLITKTSIFVAISKLLLMLEISEFEEIRPIYETASKSFKVYADKTIRAALVDVLSVIGGKFNKFQEVANIIASLNSYNTKRISEPDFERRIDAFTVLNETKWSVLDAEQWYPLLFNCLFFINDEEESSIRSNARFSLTRFVDCIAAKPSAEAAAQHVHLLKDVILPNLRVGIRRDNERVQNEYVLLLSAIVSNEKYYTDLNDMQVLFFGKDEEADFFLNVNHIQIHRRQRAIRRSVAVGPKIAANNISHYLIPIIERYVYSTAETSRNLNVEAIDAIGLLTRYVTWKQYKALLKRFISYLRTKRDFFRDVVQLVVAVSKSLQVSVYNKEIARDEKIQEVEVNEAEARGDAVAEADSEEAQVELAKGIHDKAVIIGLTNSTEEISSFVTNLFPQMVEILDERNEDTATEKVSISEALVSLILCLPEDLKIVELPSVLTKVAQILRSRSEELRDSVRKSLGKIVSSLGTKYFRFVIKELKSALRRGPQIHILSFTVHSLLVIMNPILKHGDLDDSAELIIDIVMEDTFGASAQEKEAEGYSSKTKEVKHSKSFDTAEILSSNISFTEFKVLLNPIKLLLGEHISLKTQHKLDELLRRVTLGVNHNQESKSRDALVLCYEIFCDADKIMAARKAEFKKKATESQEHFLVQLDAKPIKTQIEFSQYSNSLRKFSLDLLRTILSHNEDLVTFANLSGFIPLLEQSLRSDSEGLLIACLKLLNMLVLLPLDEEAKKRFTVCARKVLQILRNSPTTNSDLAQACLKFLASLVRHKNEDVELKNSAISYILVKLMPDLEDPNRQGLAFNFLKAVLSQHIPLPEVYDVMEKVSKIMVTNHTREVRNMARSSYFQFLMEYDQGKGKLEKEFSLLIANLDYPAEAGRLSVMELIKSILIKATPELLVKISTSFFVALSNVAVTDDSVKCRELATNILTDLFKKLNTKHLSTIEAYLISWIKQSSNNLLLRCGFQIYKLYITAIGVDVNAQLDKLFVDRLNDILVAAVENEDDDEDDNESQNATDHKWQLLYAGLTTFTKVASIRKELVLVNAEFEKFWKNVTVLLLYPHSWVRLSSAKLTGIALSNLQKMKLLTADDIQNIAGRSVRQLGAPKITPDLGNQVVKNLVFIVMHWEKNDSNYIAKGKQHEEDENEQQEQDGNTKSFKFAVEWLINKISFIMRNDYRTQDFINSKKFAVKLVAMIIQILQVDKLNLPTVSESILLGLYNFTEEQYIDESDKDKIELKELASECQKILQDKIGMSEYSKMLVRVRKIVADRRIARRAKRAQLAFTNPEAAAKRKIKKHANVRAKRRHEKDESGYYHGKKKRMY